MHVGVKITLPTALVWCWFSFFITQPVVCQSNVNSTKAPQCTAPCSCCLVTSPCNDNCRGQCKPGIFGGKCQNFCPTNCIRCTDHPNAANTSYWGKGYCTECIDGYYSTSQFYQCQLECPTDCLTCESDTNCTSCTTGLILVGTTCRNCKTGCAACASYEYCTVCQGGYYNSGGASNNLNCVACSLGCSNQCDQTSGTCTCRFSFTGDRCDRCIDGMYGNDCNIPCHTGCATCSRVSGSDCASCIHGYYLQGNTCHQCKTGCSQCFTYTNCTMCIDGYYTSDTDCVSCSYGCSNECNKGTGTCICKDGFEGEKCDRCSTNFQGTDCGECIKGYFGTLCGQSCPQHCEDKECKKLAGTCTHGCVENFSGDKCNDCVVGRYGQDCSKQCPVNCDGACNRSSGFCQHCKNNFFGNTCDECKVGKHGPNCTLNCSIACKDTKCDPSTGTCDSCKESMYGDLCNNSCPPQCLNKTCGQNTGACTDGCTPRFSGDMCCLNGSYCELCSSFSQCSNCMQGRYGKTCNDVCPTNCKGSVCDKNNGTCNQCIDGYKGHDCASTEEFKGDDDGTPGTTIGGIVAACVVFIIVVIVVGLFLRRRTMAKNRGMANGTAAPLSDERVYENETSLRSGARNKERESEKRKEMWEPPSVKSASKKKQPLATPRLHEVQTEDETSKENDYYNSGDVAYKGIAVSELAAYIDDKAADFFDSEFMKLPQGLIKPTTDALKDQNLAKNRYNAIYPYDETRVILQGPGSDFINACYIEGFRKRREYIASLGPIAKATEGYSTFWRMLWQEKTEKIVMVTNLMENGGMKCEQYWPDVNKTERYDDVTVTCHSQDDYAEYTVRSFTVKKGKEKQRSLHHIHYTAWPDKGVPDDVTSLIEFRNKVNSTKVTLGGPVIVHCSAGVGRTGTYIALDILTYKGKKTGYIDIFDCVEKLRQQRTLMVQTAGQYEYVHRALAHTLTLGSEAIPADRFQNYASSIPDTMFDKLSHCKEKVSDEDKEAIVVNRALTHLNRKGADIPGDSNRPRLYQGRTAEDTNYINAVYVNSFKVKNQFIMAQTPLPTTVKDFLTLVVQENCSCIVSMDPPDVPDKSVGTYLPADNQVLRVEPFEVKTTKVVSEGSFTKRTLAITSTLTGTETTRTVQHFQYNNWPEKSKAPSTPDKFLKLVKEVQKASDEAPTFSAVIVHCRTGSERSGLLCVVVSLLQKMEIEHEVSVINTVRQVKFRRPKAIPNKEQFTFCHTCVAAYLQTFDIYSNFS